MTAFTSGARRGVSAEYVPRDSWPRRSDQMRDDQLATAAVGLGAALVGTAVALLGRGTTAAVWAGLVTLCVTPGCALACWYATRDRLTRVLGVLAASLAWTIPVTSLFAYLQITSLSALLAATAGVGGLGSFIFLLSRLVRRLNDAQGSGSTGGPGDMPDRRNTGPYPYRRAPATPPPSQALAILLLIALTIATAVFAVSVIRVHGHAVDIYGLLPLLGISFMAATILTVVVLIIALRYIHKAWLAAVGALCLLLVELNGTPMMLDQTPFASGTFKHYGVVDYLVHGGPLSDPHDVYQQWPGFFAAAAGLVRLSGRSPLSYANWAQLFFETLNVIVLFAIARRFAPRNRVVPYIAVLLFLVVDWEGGEYYSPQTTAFEVSLLFQFFLLPLLDPTRLRWPFRNWSWLRIPPTSSWGDGSTTAIGMATRTVVPVALFGTIVITHQLSPYIIFAGVAALWVVGILRHRLIMLALAIMVIAYPLLHLTAVDANSVLSGFDFSNATGVHGFAASSPAQELGSDLAKVICLIFWGATAVCGLSYGRRFGIVLIPAILAAVPLSLILVSNYDGEGIYRVFLFSSPWCALIIAMRLVDLRFSAALRLAVLGCWTLFSALGSAQAQDFGQYPIQQVPSDEITASAYFLDHAPVNSTLVMASGTFPGRLNGRYVFHNATQSANDPELDGYPQFQGNKLEQMTPKALASAVTELAEGPAYLVIAQSMYAYQDYYGVFAPGTLQTLAPRLETSAYWKIWYKSDGTIILQALPNGTTAGKLIPSGHLQKKSPG
jgi:hypothetical protein